MRLQIALNPHLKGDVAGRATHARAMQSDLDGPIRRHSNKFDIAPVRLNGRSDQIQHFSDPIDDDGVGRARAFIRECGIGRAHSAMVRRVGSGPTLGTP